MSRKGVTTKRVKTVQTALSRISAQTAQSGWPRNEFPLGQITSVRLKSRPKFQTVGRSRITTREKSRGRPSRHSPRRARPAREPGSKPRGRATVSRTTADAPSEPGNYVPRPAENFIGQSSSVRPQRPTTNPSGHDRSDRPTRPDPIPADRPDRPSQRRGRPEARFEARFHIFKPGLTLSRL
ncbi:unnamed protein product [Microthlaspi erraticum]|uniref:Uncharacterized protein n=1 Tax=Microthlaspi erraticum TaxID=1685480 RepID=A0A6D2HVZ2_9BRAS|nr:unnamed protein product [Microthlaspi erraticum]